MKKTTPIYYIDKETPYPTENSVISSYKVGEMIGSTKSSVVYIGYDQKSNKVVLKFLKITELNENHVKTEISLLQQVSHPNIINFIEDFSYPPYHCAVIEYAPYGSLDLLVDPARPFGLDEFTVYKITVQLLDALNYLHEQNIWHRDMKLENVLVFDNNLDAPFVKISDFGLAVNASKTKPVGKVGSLGYVAPEIVKGDPYDQKVDMWSLGVIVYHLLSGEFPFPNDASFSSRRQLLMGNFSFMKDKWDTRSKEVINFIDNLLVVDPSKRMSAIEAYRHPWIQKFRKKSSPSVADIENFIRAINPNKYTPDVVTDVFICFVFFLCEFFCYLNNF